MQVLRRRNNKRTALSLFQSSWHILSIQNGNASGACVVFLPWTFIPESSKNNELLLLAYLFPPLGFTWSGFPPPPSLVGSAGLGVWRAVTWPGVRTACALSSFSPSGDGWGSIHSRPPAWVPGSGHAAGMAWMWPALDQNHVLLRAKSRVKSLTGTIGFPSFRQAVPAGGNLVLAIEFNPLVLWVRTWRLRERQCLAPCPSSSWRWGHDADQVPRPSLAFFLWLGRVPLTHAQGWSGHNSGPFCLSLSIHFWLVSQMVYTKPTPFQFKYFSPHKINKPTEETIFQLPPTPPNFLL